MENTVVKHKMPVNNQEKSYDGCLVKPSTWLYGIRWYVLFLFCFACTLQGCVWNCWGPIAQSAKEVFDWTDADIALLPSWGNIMNCVTIVPVTWLMDVKGNVQIRNDQ